MWRTFAGCGPCGRPQPQPTDINGGRLQGAVLVAVRNRNQQTLMVDILQGAALVAVRRYNNNHIYRMRTATRAAPCNKSTIYVG